MSSVITLFLFVLMVSFNPREKTWVALGDSITYLNHHPNETNNRIIKGYKIIAQQLVKVMKEWVE